MVNNNVNDSISEKLTEFISTLDRDLNSILYNNEFLNIRLKEQHLILKDQILKQISGLFISSEKIYASDSFKPILPNIWTDYQSLCIEWFYQWKKILKETSKMVTKGKGLNNNNNNVTVEFRVMKSKLSKLMKIFHRFYYQILEYITCHFDTSLVIPTKLIGDLNLESLIQKVPHLAKIRYLLQPTDKGTICVVLTFYYCLLYLGKIRYHQTILEDPFYIKFKRNRQVISSSSDDLFRKAKRYWIMAISLVPSMGQSYKQLSKLSLHDYDYSKTLYYHIRSYFARSNSSKAKDYQDIIIFFKERNWKQINKLFGEDDNVKNNVMNKLMEIIRYYLLIDNFGFNQTNRSFNENGKIFDLKYNLLLKLQDPQVFEYQDFWNETIITMIGISSIIMSRINESSSSSFSIWNEKIHEKFVEFIFDVLFQIITHINKMLSQDEDDITNIDPFLTILRVLNCWIKSNILVLRFAHRYSPICHIMSEFINQISNSTQFGWIALENRKPRRSYLFMDDVSLRDFTCIGNNLTDFNDTEVFSTNNVVNRLTGNAPKACLLSKRQEFELKLIAIVTSMKRFLNHNKCGISIKLRKENGEEKVKNNY